MPEYDVPLGSVDIRTTPTSEHPDGELLIEGGSGELDFDFSPNAPGAQDNASYSVTGGERLKPLQLDQIVIATWDGSGKKVKTVGTDDPAYFESIQA